MAVRQRVVLIAGKASIALALRPSWLSARVQFLPRRVLPNARPRSMGTRRLARREAAELAADMDDLAADGFYKKRTDGTYGAGELRPKTFGDCARLVPTWCPWVSCRHNLFAETDPETGAVKAMHPGLMPWELSATCSLRVAGRMPEDDEVTLDSERTLEAVGRTMNLTLEAIRLDEASAFRKLRRATQIKIRPRRKR
jgi:hypothetical protein